MTNQPCWGIFVQDDQVKVDFDECQTLHVFFPAEARAFAQEILRVVQLIDGLESHDG